jgi:predicted NBD/HSP70 family sugar kinase
MKNQSQQKPLFGIDLGGTKIEGIVLAGAGSTETLARLRLPTEPEKGYTHIVHQIGRIVDQLTLETGIKAESIGICTPGTVDPGSGLHKNSNTTCLNGMPFRSDLERKLGIRVAMANDANCFALAEATLGIVPKEAPDAKMVFGIIMGTGVGGGLVMEGKVWNGAHGIGGEWGHNFLNETGGPCYCGKSGCVEKVISGPALEQFYLQKSGQALKLSEIYKAHQKGGNPFATETINRLIDQFGKAVSVLVNILDPDVIVVGGGVGNIDLLYSSGRDAIAKNIFNPDFKTILLKPSLGDSAGVFGAAMLV